MARAVAERVPLADDIPAAMKATAPIIAGLSPLLRALRTSGVPSFQLQQAVRPAFMIPHQLRIQCCAERVSTRQRTLAPSGRDDCFGSYAAVFIALRRRSVCTHAAAYKCALYLRAKPLILVERRRRAVGLLWFVFDMVGLFWWGLVAGAGFEPATFRL